MVREGDLLLAGVVVLYHPDEEVFDNIKRYRKALDILFVLDNTEEPSEYTAQFFSTFSNVQYIAFHQNMGLSYALNYALKAASKYTYLLTMDQDSYFSEEMLAKYKLYITQCENDPFFSNIAMYSVHYSGLKVKSNENKKYVISAITSGSVLNVRIAKTLGGFDENLFIDEVDDEFCYRAKDAGYKVLFFGDIELIHHLGNPRQYSFFKYQFTVLNHGPIRKYYIVRNRLYVAKKFPWIKRYYMKLILKMLIKIILFEKNKGKKIKYIMRGIEDYKNKRMGKYKE